MFSLRGAKDLVLNFPYCYFSASLSGSSVNKVQRCLPYIWEYA